MSVHKKYFDLWRYRVLNHCKAVKKLPWHNKNLNRPASQHQFWLLLQKDLPHRSSFLPETLTPPQPWASLMAHSSDIVLSAAQKDAVYLDHSSEVDNLAVQYIAHVAPPLIEPRDSQDYRDQHRLDQADHQEISTIVYKDVYYIQCHNNNHTLKICAGFYPTVVIIVLQLCMSHLSLTRHLQ